MKKALRFRSEDGRFGVDLAPRQVAAMLKHTKRAGRQETGGVLVGYYNDAHDCAHVTCISPPPKGSSSSETRFERGSDGVARWLQRLWRSPKSVYYLGEWHFHPGVFPDPSAQDCAQMMAIARRESAHCPEPILLILGGDPSREWHICACVFPEGRRMITLTPVR